MLQKYERKAEDILEKLAQEEPNERNFKMMAEALIILGGGKVMEMMGGMESYDGGRMDEFARGRGGRGRGRGRGRSRDSMGRFRYDGGMDRDMDRWEDEEDEMYYDGGSRYDGQSGGGRSGGGRSGGGMGGRSGGNR